MGSPDPLDEVTRAKATLRDGLTLLEATSSGASDLDDAGLRAAWEKMLQGLGNGSRLVELRGLVSPAELPAYDAELREVMRLNAVLMSAVKAEQERVVDRLCRVRKSHRELAYYGAVSGEGERCDIRG